MPFVTASLFVPSNVSLKILVRLTLASPVTVKAPAKLPVPTEAPLIVEVNAELLNEYVPLGVLFGTGTFAVKVQVEFAAISMPVRLNPVDPPESDVVENVGAPQLTPDPV